MSELEVQRTLVKSPPELWAELSDIALLARLLDEQFGAIEIIGTRPERSLWWKSSAASGTVALEASGWGTRVRLTAEVENAAERAGAEATLAAVLDEVGKARHRPFSRA
jgi:hypothetical protein